MNNIFDVLVNKISLIRKWKRPAVPKAETKYAIFKEEKKDIKYLIKLERIKQRLQKDIENRLNKDKKE